MPVATTRFWVASSSGRTLGSRGEPPSQKTPYPSSSTSLAASAAFSSPRSRYLVQTPIVPRSIASFPLGDELGGDERHLEHALLAHERDADGDVDQRGDQQSLQRRN